MRGFIAWLGAIAVALTIGTAPARADDRAAIRKVLDAQVKAIARHDGLAFARTFGKDGFAMLPGGYAPTATAAGVAMGRAWAAEAPAVKARVDKAVIGHDGATGWITADVTVVQADPADRRPHDVTYRVTALLRRTGTAWLTQATYWSIAEPDDDQQWVNALYEDDGDDGDGGDAPPTAPGFAWIAQPAELATHLRAGKDVVVLGSAPRERGAGPAGAKLLAGWKRIRFAPAWRSAGGDGASYAWLAGRIERPAQANGETIQIPYWTLVLLVKAAGGWEVVSAHFGQTMPMAGMDPPDDE